MACLSLHYPVKNDHEFIKPKNHEKNAFISHRCYYGFYIFTR